MGSFNDRIRSVLDSINDDRVRELLNIAKGNAGQYETVAKGAVHYERLGSSDSRKRAFIARLILELEALEEQAPHLKPDENVANMLSGTLAGRTGIHEADAAASDSVGWQLEQRVVAAKTLLAEIAKKRPLKVVMPLLAALQNATQRKHAMELLDGITQRRFGAADTATLKRLIGVITSAMHLDKSDTEEADYAIAIAARIIEEAENPLVYFVGSLLGTMQDPTCAEPAKRLLDSALTKNLGMGDTETLRELVGIISAAINLDRSTKELQGYAMQIAKKVIEEGQNQMIYLAAPLLVALQNPAQQEPARQLLDMTLRKKLGKVDGATFAESAKTFIAFTNPTISTKEQQSYALALVNKTIDENENPLIYLAGPLLAAMRYPAQAESTRRALDRAMDKGLGTGDAGVLQELARGITAAINTERSTPEEIEYAVNIGRKIIDEGKNPLMYFTGPLVAATQNPAQNDAAKQLLDAMQQKVRNGGTLGRVDEDIRVRTIKILTGSAQHGGERAAYAEFFIAQMKKEGTWNSNRQEWPAWVPKPAAPAQLRYTPRGRPPGQYR